MENITPEQFFEDRVIACPMSGRPDLAVLYPDAARFLVIAGLTPDEWYLHESWFTVGLPPSFFATAKVLSPKCLLHDSNRYAQLVVFELLMGNRYENLRAIALDTLKEEFNWEPKAESGNDQN